MKGLNSIFGLQSVLSSSCNNQSKHKSKMTPFWSIAPCSLIEIDVSDVLTARYHPEDGAVNTFET
jgi:hypothetical protein